MLKVRPIGSHNSGMIYNEMLITPAIKKITNQTSNWRIKYIYFHTNFKANIIANLRNVFSLDFAVWNYLRALDVKHSRRLCYTYVCKCSQGSECPRTYLTQLANHSTWGTNLPFWCVCICVCVSVSHKHGEHQFDSLTGCLPRGSNWGKAKLCSALPRIVNYSGGSTYT